MGEIASFHFTLVDSAGETLVVAVRRPAPHRYIVVVTQGAALVSIESFSNGPDAIIRSMKVRDEFLAQGWRIGGTV